MKCKKCTKIQITYAAKATIKNETFIKDIQIFSQDTSIKQAAERAIRNTFSQKKLFGGEVTYPVKNADYKCTNYHILEVYHFKKPRFFEKQYSFVWFKDRNIVDFNTGDNQLIYGRSDLPVVNAKITFFRNIDAYLIVYHCI